MNIISCFKLPEKYYSVTIPGAHILLGYDDTKLFETTRIKNHSVIAPSVPQKSQSVPAPSAQIYSGYDLLQCQHKNITHIPVEKLHLPEKEYICFQMYGKTPMLHSVTSHVHILN